MKALHVSPFINCCGVQIIYGFPFTPTTNQLKYVEEDIVTVGKKRQVGVYLVTINNDQKPYYHDMLVKHGYEEIIKDFYNPQHGSTISMYSYTVIAKETHPDPLAVHNEYSLFSVAPVGFY